MQEQNVGLEQDWGQRGQGSESKAWVPWVVHRTRGPVAR